MEKKIVKYLENFDVYEIYPIGFINKLSHNERLNIEYKIRMLLVDEKAKEISYKFNIAFSKAKEMIIKDSFV